MFRYSALGISRGHMSTKNPKWRSTARPHGRAMLRLLGLRDPTFCLWPVCPVMTTDCDISWWRHQMETFCPLLALCAGNSPVNGEFPSQRPGTRSFDIFFDLRLSKHSWGWWFETPSRSLWRRCNDREHMAFTEWKNHQNWVNKVAARKFENFMWNYIHSIMWYLTENWVFHSL